MPARILVVDDDPDILEVTGFAVEKAGFETPETTFLMFKHHFDVFLTLL